MEPIGRGISAKGRHKTVSSQQLSGIINWITPHKKYHMWWHRYVINAYEFHMGGTVILHKFFDGGANIYIPFCVAISFIQKITSSLNCTIITKRRKDLTQHAHLLKDVIICLEWANQSCRDNVLPSVEEFIGRVTESFAWWIWIEYILENSMTETPPHIIGSKEVEGYSSIQTTPGSLHLVCL